MAEPVKFSCIELRGPVMPVSLRKEYLCRSFDTSGSFPDSVYLAFPATAQRSKDLILAGNDAAWQ